MGSWRTILAVEARGKLRCRYCARRRSVRRDSELFEKLVGCVYGAPLHKDRTDTSKSAGDTVCTIICSNDLLWTE